MKLKDLNLSKKFLLSFGVLIAFIITVVIWSLTGIGNITKDAHEVIDGNKLRAEITQREVDHLVWANELNELFTNIEKTKLDVETDHHKCALGKWYYSHQREEAEKLVPEIAPLLQQLEEPHRQLHESAKHIDKVFVQADQHLGVSLATKKADHLNWLNSAQNSILSRSKNLDLITDHTECELGKWLHSEEFRNMKQRFPELSKFEKSIEKPHQDLHESAITLEQYLARGNFAQAENYYNNSIKNYAEKVIAQINQVIDWNQTNLKQMDKAGDIYVQETTPSLKEVRHIMKEIIQLSNQHIMTDEQMVADAQQTRQGTIIFSSIAVIFAIVIALVMGRSILIPIRKSLNFVNRIAKGDLTVKSEINQKDEIGELARSMQNMANRLNDIITDIYNSSETIVTSSNQLSSASEQISQGASEQASSTEEVSSSMEEMVSNIEQNADNSKQTETIAVQALSGIRESSTSNQTAMEAMKNIAEKINIINDIAFQTNILALNAAVEAARAGEHGKGFAVVAAEVRKLAERSKVAADEIVTLADNGVQVSEKANHQLNAIMPEIEKTANLIQEISAASTEQRSGSDQINSAIQQLNDVVQQNAAHSEEMATSSEELSSMAESMRESVAFFKIRSAGKSQINSPSIAGKDFKSQQTFPASEQKQQKKKSYAINKALQNEENDITLPSENQHADQSYTRH